MTISRSPADNDLTTVAIILVLTAAVAHSSWNMMVRRSTTPAVTTALMAVVSAVVVMPLAIYLLVTDFPSGTGWWFILATIVLHIFYFATLGYAYSTGELTVVYPIARGLGVAIIPILGVFILGESMTILAVLGAVSIVVGIAGVMASDVRIPPVGIMVAGIYNLVTRNRPEGQSMPKPKPAILLAVATGVVIGIYSVVDKQGVQHVTPALYMFWLQLGGGLGMIAFMSRFETRDSFVSEWSRHWKIILFGGVLQFAAYTLVLTALQTSQVSYVGPFRELAVLFGVIYGAMALKERVTPLRAAGALAIAAGAVAIAMA